MNKPPLCALIVGHSKGDGGAVSWDRKTNEYQFNDALASKILGLVRPEICGVTLLHRVGGYAKLPGRVNATGADFAVEMHFNDDGAPHPGKASGTEVLYFHRSEKGRLLAWVLQQKLVEALHLPDRKTKPQRQDGRGGYLLYHTAMPCVIAEPFFGDNEGDFTRATILNDALAAAYARAIECYAGMLQTGVETYQVPAT